MQDYVKGKGVIWLDDDKRWQTMAADRANAFIAWKVEELGLEGADRWLKAHNFMVIDEAARLGWWSKKRMGAAAVAICDNRVAFHFPQGSHDLEDEDILHAFEPWASFKFELCRTDLEIAAQHFGRELDAEERAALRDQVELTAIGYCGL